MEALESLLAAVKRGFLRLDYTRTSLFFYFGNSQIEPVASNKLLYSSE